MEDPWTSLGPGAQPRQAKILEFLDSLLAVDFIHFKFVALKPLLPAVPKGSAGATVGEQKSSSSACGSPMQDLAILRPLCKNPRALDSTNRSYYTLDPTVCMCIIYVLGGLGNMQRKQNTRKVDRPFRVLLMALSPFHVRPLRLEVTGTLAQGGCRGSPTETKSGGSKQLETY